MRRFGWQISGISVAIVAIVVLGLLAFGCGSGSRVVGITAPKATPRPTPTVDPRAADVEAAARRYVQALADSMKTGSPTELDALSAPGSQAEGNAGVAAEIVHDKHVAFVTTRVEVATVATTVNSSTAEVSLDYALSGYDATWPGLAQESSPRTIHAHWTLDFTLAGDAWLVDTAG